MKGFIQVALTTSALLFLSGFNSFPSFADSQVKLAPAPRTAQASGTQQLSQVFIQVPMSAQPSAGQTGNPVHDRAMDVLFLVFAAFGIETIRNIRK